MTRSFWHQNTCLSHSSCALRAKPKFNGSYTYSKSFLFSYQYPKFSFCAAQYEIFQ